jgi:hypothetical protein
MLATMATRTGQGRRLPAGPIPQALRMSLVLLAVVVLMTTQTGCGNNSHKTAQDPPHNATRKTEPPQSQQFKIDPEEANTIVVRTGKQTITQGYLERWTSLEVVLASKFKKDSAIPTGFVPDPPSYQKCIAYLGEKSHSPPDASKLKLECEGLHFTQVRSTLWHLLRYAWTYEEARKLHLFVNSSEIQSEYANSGINPVILKAIDVPPSYQNFLIGAELLTTKIFEHLPAYAQTKKPGKEDPQAANEIDGENSKFYTAMVNRWTQKTHCSPEFFVEGCSEYAAEAP